jgi:hypothetical protein
VRSQVLTVASVKTSSGMLRHAVWYKFTDVSQVLADSIIKAMTDLMMEEASTSETSVNF